MTELIKPSDKIALSGGCLKKTGALLRDVPSVLIVHGSEIVQSSLRSFLEGSGYHVIESAYGKEGLAGYAYQPDIILTDLKTSHSNKSSIVAKLQEIFRSIPIIVISGKKSLPDALEAVRQGAWDYLTLPLNSAELEVTMKRALEWVRLHDENLRYREQLEEAVHAKTRELRNSRERYQRLLESVTNYVYTVFFEDGRPTQTVHQPVCEKVTGYTSAEYNASPDLWYRIVHDDDRLQVLDMTQRILKETKSLKLEHRIHHKDGSLRWIRNTLVPCRDMNGDLVAYDGIIADITERKLADIKLRESEERFSQLFLQHEDAIILFKLDSFEIVDANPAATELYGFDRDELLGPFPWRFVGDDAHECRVMLQNALEFNNRFKVEMISQLRKDGNRVPVSMRGNVVTLQDDKVVCCSIRNISDKILLEEEVRNTQALLIHANKMASLGMLASGIAHEINNPNNFIMFNSALLAETWQAVLEVLDEHRAEYGDFYLAGQRFSEVREELPHLIAGMSEGSRRIQAIIETLKGFVRQDHDCSEVDINRTVQMAITLLSHEIRKHVRNVTVELGNDLPYVAGKSQQIEQVVINLVTNALHAVAENGGGIRVATSCDRAKRLVTITVQDNGVGMTKEELERVAEPFFTTRSVQGGTGLGVSISLSIVREHNGTLTYDSEPGEGTTATVRLPVSDGMITQGNPAGEAQ